MSVSNSISTSASSSNSPCRFNESKPPSDPHSNSSGTLHELPEKVKQVADEVYRIYKTFVDGWTMQRSIHIVNSVLRVQRMLEPNCFEKIAPNPDTVFRRLVEKDSFYTFFQEEPPKQICSGQHKFVFQSRKFTTENHVIVGREFFVGQSHDCALYLTELPYHFLASEKSLMDEHLDHDAPLLRFWSLGRLSNQLNVATTELFDTDLDNIDYSKFVDPIQEFVSIHVQCLEALSYIHARNLIHRDIKAANFGCFMEGAHTLIKLADCDSLMKKPTTYHRAFYPLLFVDLAQFGPADQVLINMKKMRAKQDEMGDIKAFANMLYIETLPQLLIELIAKYPPQGAMFEEVYFTASDLDKSQFDEEFNSSPENYSTEWLQQHAAQFQYRVIYCPAMEENGSESIITMKTAQDRFDQVMHILDILNQGSIPLEEYNRLKQIASICKNILDREQPNLTAEDYAFQLKALQKPDYGTASSETELSDSSSTSSHLESVDEQDNLEESLNPKKKIKS